MFRRFTSWLGSWGTTLHIMIFERETYRILRGPFDPDDYIEAGTTAEDE